jgi:hypothetical protein
MSPSSIDDKGAETFPEFMIHDIDASPSETRSTRGTWIKRLAGAVFAVALFSTVYSYSRPTTTYVGRLASTVHASFAPGRVRVMADETLKAFRG